MRVMICLDYVCVYEMLAILGLIMNIFGWAIELEFMNQTCV